MLQKPKKIPENPGVYIFRDTGKKPLYIGKAASIKRRLASYFQSTISDRVRRLREEARSLSFETTETEFDALIREAELIKKYRPKFNILMRDDRNYYYVVFTNETFPRIFVTHQPINIQSKKQEARSMGHKTLDSKFLIHDSRILGPFTEGSALFMILRLLRKLFPYCTCKRPHKRPCVNSEMGRCFGFCCTIRSKKFDTAERITYKKSIQSIRNILSGKSKTLLRELKKEMTGAAREKRYEKAGEIRNQYLGLQSIISHRHIIEDRNPFIFRRAKASLELQHILKRENPVARIEGYDISNISGKEATASRVVFIDGKPEKSEYKRFKIRYKGISDFDMLEEVMVRRLNHPEWPLPDLMLIDGGSPQLRAVAKVLARHYKTRNSKEFPFSVAGLSKFKTPEGRTRRKASGEETLTILGGSTTFLKHIALDSMHLLQAVRDESHRFAKKYHTLLRKKSFL